MNVTNEWFHLVAVVVLGMLIHRLEKRLDTLQALQLDMARVKALLRIP